MSAHRDLPQSRHIVTELPGPLSQELIRRRDRAVPDAVYRTVPIFVSRARGAMVEDVDGNRFIDMASGIAVLNVGSANPRVVEAIAQQASKYTHTCFHVSMNEPYVAVAERLNSLAPGDFEKRTVLVNSGSEAVETAARIARYYTGKDAIAVFDNAFHGRTHLASTMTDAVLPWKNGFGSDVHDVFRLPFAYPYRCPSGGTQEQCGLACANRAIDLLDRVIGPDRVACIVMEPVLGVGGGVVPPREFVRMLTDYCAQNDILFVADEIQTAFGRTGRWFGMEHFGVAPDLVATAKALGGGMPVAAVTGRSQVMDAVHVGGLGSTLGGNPVACAAALAALDEIEESELTERAERLGTQIHDTLAKLADECQLIGEVRGLGAMYAVELVLDGQKTPAGEAADNVLQRCYKEGVIIIKAGVHGNVLRLLPPLNIDRILLDDALGVISNAIELETRGR